MGIEGEGKGIKQLHRQMLGDETVLTTEAIENDRWAQTMLTEIGKTMAEPGFKHLGSAAVHIYGTDTKMLVETSQAQVKHQLALGDTAEQLVAVAVAEFGKRVVAKYRGERRSIDPTNKVQV